MTRMSATVIMIGALAGLAAAPAKWQFAGENQGIRFYFKIAHACQSDGAEVEVKLENTLDHAVTLNFRVVDPEWKMSFERELPPKVVDTAIHFIPEEGSACHPYVDNVYLESKETQVSQSGEQADETRPTGERSVPASN